MIWLSYFSDVLLKIQFLSENSTDWRSLSQWALSESGKHSLKGQTHSTDLWLNTELCLFTFLLFYTPFERCKYCVRFLYVLINLIFLKGCDLLILSHIFFDSQEMTTWFYLNVYWILVAFIIKNTADLHGGEITWEGESFERE